jgi:starch phosphorylase
VLEGYDLSLARRLVQGCDVWLNNPEYPLEACGTSGQKAGINGAVNVSVLDGWWDEGFVADGEDGPNGFAVTPADLRFWNALGTDEAARRERDVEECRQLLDIVERDVVPRYFGAPGHAPYGPEWIRIARNSMKTLIPRYNSARMVIDYVRDMYGPAAKQGRALAEAAAATALAEWKRKVRQVWSGVRLRVAAGPPALTHGQRLPLRAMAFLNGLAPTDVAVECELGRTDAHGSFTRQRVVPLNAQGNAGDEAVFTAELEPLSGRQHYRVRMRPRHAALSHPFEVGLVVWA